MAVEYITVDFQISMKRSTRRKCCRCGCKRLIEFLEPSHISQLGYIQWQCATKMDNSYRSKPCFPIDKRQYF